jgi:CheY-like chemotaxis protein
MSSRHEPVRLEGVRVLIVDDNFDGRELVQLALERHGAIVTAADSAREALATLQRERPDVLLSDVSMPTEDGYWLIAQVRALPPALGGRTPAAAVTALTSALDRAALLRAGFQFHVPKPLDPLHLVGIGGVLALNE